MRVNGVQHQSIQVDPNGWSVAVVDQRALPHAYGYAHLRSLDDVVEAINTMMIRGAPLIGVTAAYGVALALREDPSDEHLASSLERLRATRPTAVNLAWALEEMRRGLAHAHRGAREAVAYELAATLADEEAARCRNIGEHGLQLLREAWEKKGARGRLNVLTHCNAGWLATVDYGTALAPIYLAHDAGIPVHVWVDETRPRNQGLLTAWELSAHGVAHTLVADNAGGHLMRRGEVDLCIVGADRVTSEGDVCNKIGTYLKALAAHDNAIPFYVAMPASTIDWRVRSGDDIVIEERSADEVRRVRGLDAERRPVEVEIATDRTPVSNPAFDVTPARLVTSLVTERGVCRATRAGLIALYPEHA